MNGHAPPRILCVDDEPNLLDGLIRHLRHHFQIATAADGEQGLVAVQRQGPFAVVMSDLRMPGMDGISFLRRVREVAPEAVRILLTGQGDFNTAVAAINEGHVFRFLTKPCPPPIVLKAIQAGAEQYRLLTAERVLLKETLQGSIKVLLDILAISNPAAWGMATRARGHAVDLLSHLKVSDSWHIEIAAMLSQLGSITLPTNTMEKFYHGQALTPAERAMVDRLPEVGAQMVASIPRLGPVRENILYHCKRYDGSGLPADPAKGEAIPFGARVLKLVLDYDVLKSQGQLDNQALETLRAREGWYDGRILEEFAKIHARAGGWAEEKTLYLRDIQEGMVFAEDVKTKRGMLLVARGQELTWSMLARIRNLSENIGVKEPIQVIVRETAPVVEELQPE
jgi:response regulator RpfG family c-di-GMP phosphodiesterase